MNFAAHLFPLFFLLSFANQATGSLAAHNGESFPRGVAAAEKPTNTDDTPRQPNGFDCGIYVCNFVARIILGYPIITTQDEIDQYRRWIALTIVNGRLPVV